MFNYYYYFVERSHCCTSIRAPFRIRAGRLQPRVLSAHPELSKSTQRLETADNIMISFSSVVFVFLRLATNRNRGIAVSQHTAASIPTSIPVGPHPARRGSQTQNRRVIEFDDSTSYVLELQQFQSNLTKFNNLTFEIPKFLNLNHKKFRNNIP